jgi:hypothetical protein
MKWNATISVESPHFTFRQTSVLRNQIVIGILKQKNFGDGIFFQTPDTLNFTFLVCSVQWFVNLSLSNEQEYLRVKKMVSKWSYEHCLLISGNYMAKLCIQQQLIHPPKKKLFIQP